MISLTYFLHSFYPIFGHNISTLWSTELFWCIYVSMWVREERIVGDEDKDLEGAIREGTGEGWWAVKEREGGIESDRIIYMSTFPCEVLVSPHLGFALSPNQSHMEGICPSTALSLTWLLTFILCALQSITSLACFKPMYLGRTIIMISHKTLPILTCKCLEY